MKPILLFSVFALAVSPNLFASGPSSSGGGPSILCRGPDQKIQTAQLLDLYEGQIRYGLTIAASATAGQSQLQAAFDRLQTYDWFIASDVANALAKVEAKIAFLPAGVIMAPGVDLGDSYAALIPDGCELAYAGYYESDGTLRISQDIYDKLDETDRAALFMHEAIYKVARDIGGQHNSLAAREINAYLFSTVADLSPLDAIKSQVTWLSHFGPSNSYLVHAPVKVAAPEPTITIVASQPATGLTVSCYDSDGTEIDLTNSLTSLELTQTLPASGCALIWLAVVATPSDTGPPAPVQLQLLYGDQVILTATTAPGIATQDYSAGIPIYAGQAVRLPGYKF